MSCKVCGLMTHNHMSGMASKTQLRSTVTVASHHSLWKSTYLYTESTQIYFSIVLIFITSYSHGVTSCYVYYHKYYGCTEVQNHYSECTTCPLHACLHAHSSQMYIGIYNLHFLYTVVVLYNNIWLYTQICTLELKDLSSTCCM